MVATKRGPLADVEINSSKERTSTTNEAGSLSQEPLGGFIFVCNNDTMDEDFERHLFGLPQKYQDLVKAIQPGLPLFLYNYSTRCLHGVFEASSDGALNIEPDAYGEIKDTRKNGRQPNSRFPAQVRMRWREERPPLEEEKFRPILYHYDGPKFRLQLSKTQAQELLKLFGASSVRKMEEAQEDSGGEWERVKTKSKAGRGFRATVPKGSISPNSTAGSRRRGGTGQNGLNSNGGTAMHSNPVHEPPLSRGRERDTQQPDNNAIRWRIDSDAWSGSSSAGTSSSSGLHDEDRSKRGGQRENGFVVEIVPTSGPSAAGGGPGFGCDGSTNGVAASAKGGGFMHTKGNASGVDANHKVEVRLIDDDSNEINSNSSVTTTTSTTAAGQAANPYARPGFASYSAALKSGMLNAVDNGSGEFVVAPPEISPNGSSPGTQRSSSMNSSYSSAAATTAANLSPSSPGKFKKGDPLIEKIDVPNHKLDGRLSKVRHHGEGLPNNNNQGRLSPARGSSDVGKQEVDAADTSTGGSEDGTDGKRTDRAQPWGKPLVPRATPLEIPGGPSISPEINQRPTLNQSGDVVPPKKSAKEAFRSNSGEAQVGEPNVVVQSLGSSTEMKDNSDRKCSELHRKSAWQSNDSTILRLLHDPDPAVNSSLTNGKAGADHGTGNFAIPDKQVKDQTPAVTQDLTTRSSQQDSQGGFSQPLPSETHRTQYSKDVPSSPMSSSAAMSPHGFQSKSLSVEAPEFQQQSKPIVFEARRQQFDNQKQEKNQEERQHLRKQQQQGHPQHHLQQHAASVMQTQSQALGPGGFVSLQIPASHPGMQRHHHHNLLSPQQQNPMYQDRSRSRAVLNGPGDFVHGLAAHGSINRNLLDAESAVVSSALAPGGWGLAPPMLLMQPVISPITGAFIFPPPSPLMLVNVEELHAEIRQFALAAHPSAETRVHAEIAVECVRGIVKQLWPEADVEVFGSFATGLCLHHSDVDVVVVDTPAPEESTGNGALSGARPLTPLIRSLASALKDNEWCEVLNTIETASMPVIKLRCTPNVGGSSSSPVAIDITIGGRESTKYARVSSSNSIRAGGAGSKPANPTFEAARSAHNGAAAREFVIERLKQLPALFPLVLLLKSFLRTRNLNDVYSGGLGSFALTLMLVFYLERVPISCGIPQDLRSSTSKSPSPAPGSTDTSAAVSVDMSQASVPAAESIESSDADPTRTVASAMTSAEATSLQENPPSEDIGPASAAVSSSPDGPVLRKGGGLVEDLVNSMDTVASPNLGTLLVGFLYFFGQEIDFSRVRLVLKGKGGNPGGLFWHEKNARTLPLWIDDPLRPDGSIGAGSFNIRQVQAAMCEMLAAITRPRTAETETLSDDQEGGDSGRKSFSLLQEFC